MVQRLTSLLTVMVLYQYLCLYWPFMNPSLAAERWSNFVPKQEWYDRIESQLIKLPPDIESLFRTMMKETNRNEANVLREQVKEVFSTTAMLKLLSVPDKGLVRVIKDRIKLTTCSDSLSLGCTPFSFAELEFMAKACVEFLVEKGGFIRCQARKKAIPWQEVKRVEKVLWNDPDFRGEYPANNCFSRSILISKKLDDWGYQSRKIFIATDFIGIHPYKGKYRINHFILHISNVVDIRMADNGLEAFVIDPMYTDHFMPIKEYIEKFVVDFREGGVYVRPQTFNDRGHRETCEYSKYKLQWAKHRINQAKYNKSVRELFLEDHELELYDTKELALKSRLNKYFICKKLGICDRYYFLPWKHNDLGPGE